MTGKLIKLNNIWHVKSFLPSGTYYDLHPDNVKEIEQDSYQFDNIESRIAAYPDVEFSLVSLVDGGIIYAKLIQKTEEYVNNLGLKPSDMESNTINFFTNMSAPEATLKLCANGDIYVKGKLVKNDIEVVEGLREFLNQVNKKSEESWDDIYEEYSKDEYPAFGGPFTHAMTFIEWLKLNYNLPIRK
jgi:hypothetical protein